MRPHLVLARWGRRSTLMGAPGGRLESVPPSLRQPPSSAWQRFMFWLLAPSPQDVSPSLSQLPKVRTEFLAALADIGGDDADRLRVRLHEARSLRELWHARSELYRVVGIAHSQAQAEQRMLLVNRHFPARAPRSQFAPL
ncbi:MAG: hypothetical protein LH480_05580 [Rubrivivax sp.]|nr:hypothetical protein [Rubrivivax sp.]